MECAADWLVGARAATEYVRVGACRRCGRCCRLLGMELPERLVGRRWLLRAIRAWHTYALNFEALGEVDRMIVYRCRYYREADPARLASEPDLPAMSFKAWQAGVRVAGGCAIYPFRHRLCRFFPRQGLTGHPKLHEECGFRFVRRDVLARRRQRTRDGQPTFADFLKP